jgi:protein-serine/threonine kinase
LIPSFKGFSSSKDPPGSSYSNEPRRSSAQPPPKSSGRNSYRQTMPFGPAQSRSPSQSTTGSTIPVQYDVAVDRQRDQRDQRDRRGVPASPGAAIESYSSQQGGYNDNNANSFANKEINIKESHPVERQRQTSRHNQQYSQHSPRSPGVAAHSSTLHSQSAPAMPQAVSYPYQQQQQSQQQHRGYAGEDDAPLTTQYTQQSQSKLHKPNRKFGDAYEEQHGQHGGSSGAARRVMDFFRKRSKARGSE